MISPQTLHAVNDEFYAICSESSNKMSTVKNFISLYETVDNQTTKFQRDLNRWGLSEAGLPTFKKIVNLNNIKQTAGEYVYLVDTLKKMHTDTGDHINGLWNNYNNAINKKNHYINNHSEIFSESVVVEVKHARRTFGIKGHPYYTYHTEQRFNKAAYDQSIQNVDVEITNATTALNEKLDYMKKSVVPEKIRLEKIKNAYQICVGANDELSKVIIQQQNFIANVQKNHLNAKNTEFSKLVKEMEDIMIQLNSFLDLYQQYKRNYENKTEEDIKLLDDDTSVDEISYNPNDVMLKNVKNIVKTSDKKMTCEKYAANIKKANQSNAMLKHYFEKLLSDMNQDIAKIKDIVDNGNKLIPVCSEGIANMQRVMATLDLLRQNASMFAKIMATSNDGIENQFAKTLSHIQIK